jgi:hypothetical protein
MAAAGGDGITIDSIIEKLLGVRGARPGKQGDVFTPSSLCFLLCSLKLFHNE